MIIFINGSVHAGKSTVAKLMAEKLGNTALVEIDTLRDFVAWLPIEGAVPISLKNAVDVIKNFAETGLHIVVPYPLSKRNYGYLSDGLAKYSHIIKVFTLSPSLEVALSKRGERDLTDDERSRIEHHYRIGIPTPDFGVIIDNSNETPKQTTDQIFKIISATET